MLGVLQSEMHCQGGTVGLQDMEHAEHVEHAEHESQEQVSSQPGEHGSRNDEHAEHESQNDERTERAEHAIVPAPIIETCNICLQNIHLDGAHRAACLKCGHVFGHSCVTAWLGVQGRTACPICSVEAEPSDVRIMYLNGMTVEAAPSVSSMHHRAISALVIRGFQDACIALHKARTDDEMAEKANTEALEALHAAFRVRDDARIMYKRAKKWVRSQEQSDWYREASSDLLSESKQRMMKMYEYEKERHRAKAAGIVEVCDAYAAQGDTLIRRHKAALALTGAQNVYDDAYRTLVDEIMSRTH